MTMAASTAFSPHLRLSPSSSKRISRFGIGLRPRPIDGKCLIRASASLSDPFVLQVAEILEDSLPSTSAPAPLQTLRDASSESLLSTPWPSRKDEPFRFTDTSIIKSVNISPVSLPPPPPVVEKDEEMPILVIVDGHVASSLSDLSGLGLEYGVCIGMLSSLDLEKNEALAKRVSDYVAAFEVRDLFWSLNGVGAPDMLVVYVPEGFVVEKPLHLRYYSSSVVVSGDDKLPVSNPRVLVMVDNGGEIGVVEEFMAAGEGNGSYWSNSVTEFVVGEGAKVEHSYTQSQSLNAAHIKWTSVRQESASTYKLVEISSGGKLSRHNVHVKQLGPDTITELSTFHLCVSDQTQDLHSKIVLDHPRGVSRQLHKCIVAHSDGQAVFDGNVQVNRFAQQTDAGQLTRSLLLEPRATVNIKPNLQIIADDVKCSHGAAISDLEKDQLFYFRARGVDLETVREALIFSFAATVIQKLPYPFLRTRVEKGIKQLLESRIKKS
uniref:SUF system FeS cluster assembly SufBD core domain-containing protein n=1 Tax=Kalanchoe fedtschenkoi TaxID=63787 RepID=A0A7N0TE25_KALFE